MKPTHDSRTRGVAHSFTCSIDGTAERPDYGPGRLISHSRVNPNLKTVKLTIQHIPHLIFVACRDIEENEEVAYDYGEMDADVLCDNPWLSET